MLRGRTFGGSILFFRTVFFCLGCALLIIALGCGNVFQLESIQVSPATTSFVGIGGTQQLTVTGTFRSKDPDTISGSLPEIRTEDITKRVTYQLQAPTDGGIFAPPTALTVSNTGLVKAVDAACTWTVALNGTTKVYTGHPYVVVATLEGKQGAGLINLASSASCDSPAVGGTDPVIYDIPAQYRPHQR